MNITYIEFFLFNIFHRRLGGGGRKTSFFSSKERRTDGKKKCGSCSNAFLPVTQSHFNDPARHENQTNNEKKKNERNSKECTPAIKFTSSLSFLCWRFNSSPSCFFFWAQKILAQLIIIPFTFLPIFRFNMNKKIKLKIRINQSINQSIQHTINQSTIPSINRSINQSIDRRMVA